MNLNYRCNLANHCSSELRLTLRDFKGRSVFDATPIFYTCDDDNLSFFNNHFSVVVVALVLAKMRFFQPIV